MAERRMAEIVGERQRLAQILIEGQRTGERAGDLRDFERVGQAGAVVASWNTNTGAWAMAEHDRVDEWCVAPKRAPVKLGGSGCGRRGSTPVRRVGRACRTRLNHHLASQRLTRPSGANNIASALRDP
jgi:hypothetical protein